MKKRSRAASRRAVMWIIFSRVICPPTTLAFAARLIGRPNYDRRRQRQTRQADQRSRCEEGREEEWRNIKLSEQPPEELRAKRVRAYLTDLLEAARSAHEATAVFHHTSYSITELDSLKLHP